MTMSQEEAVRQVVELYETTLAECHSMRDFLTALSRADDPSGCDSLDASLMFLESLKDPHLAGKFKSVELAYIRNVISKFRAKIHQVN